MGCSKLVLPKTGISLEKLEDVQDEILPLTKKHQVLLSKSGSSGAFGTKAPVLFAYYYCCFLFCIYIHKGMSSAAIFIVITETRAMISACTLSLLFAATFLAAPLENQGEKMDVGWASVMLTSLYQPSLSTNGLKISYVFCSSSDNSFLLNFDPHLGEKSLLEALERSKAKELNLTLCSAPDI